jgi:hypothetical protein
VAGIAFDLDNSIISCMNKSPLSASSADLAWDEKKCLWLVGWKVWSKASLQLSNKKFLNAIQLLVFT